MLMPTWRFCTVKGATRRRRRSIWNITIEYINRYITNEDIGCNDIITNRLKFTEWRNTEPRRNSNVLLYRIVHTYIQL